MDKKEEYLIIPPEKLSSEVLEQLIEEFILREGTDYGHFEPTIEDKKQKIYKQLKSGHINILYSSLTQDTTLTSKF